MHRSLARPIEYGPALGRALEAARVTKIPGTAGHRGRPSSAGACPLEIGIRADVERLARGLEANAVFRRQRDLTLLTGQIEKRLPAAGAFMTAIASSATV